MNPFEDKSAAVWMKDDLYLRKKFDRIRWELNRILGNLFRDYDPEKEN